MLKNGSYGELAQLGERMVRNHEVRGSIPLFSTTFNTPSFGAAFFVFHPHYAALTPCARSIFRTRIICPLAALLCRFFVSVLRVYLQRCYACYNSRPYVSALSTKGFA